MTDPAMPACPECGGHDFRRVAGGNYTAEERIDLENYEGFIEEEDIETNRMNDTGWECYSHGSTPELRIAIDEWIDGQA